MNRPAWDYTLFERMSPGFVEKQQPSAVKPDDSPPVSKTLKAPSLDQLDFGKPAQKPKEKESSQQGHGTVKPCGPPRTVEEVETGNARKRRTKVIVLAEVILLVALLLVANEFYGRPLRKTRWVKMDTYRNFIGEVFASDETVNRNSAQPKVKNIKGIAYGKNKKPSAIIDDQIVHEGDVIYGIIVKEIGPDGISFEADGETWRQKVD